MATASGRSYDDYVRSEILDPLGMSDTTTEIPAEHHGGRLAVGHTARNRDGSRDPMPLFQSRSIAPAAGFASTAEDLARFASWQLRLRGQGGTLESTPRDATHWSTRSMAKTAKMSATTVRLRAATLREMQRVHWVDPDWKTTYGLGFKVAGSGDATLKMSPIDESRGCG